MAGQRLALIIACSEYTDLTLKRLAAPTHDAKGLAEILGKAEIGNFGVRTLLNEPSYKINQEIEDFFSEDRTKDDFLLLYFSCHGIKGIDGQLYYATFDTFRKRLRTTSVRASFVNEVMSSCRASRQVLLLDCCHSGAFAKGHIIKADNEIHTNEYFEVKEGVEGRGRLVMTASDSMQFSFEPDSDTLKKEGKEEMKFSIFTSAIVKGLKTGEADMDGNGHVTYDELYEYVSNQVKQQMPQQTPRKWGFDTQGQIIIARNPNPPKPKQIEGHKYLAETRVQQDLQFTNENLLKLLLQGKVEEFNRIREQNGYAELFFDGLKLASSKLVKVNLHKVYLTKADLSKVDLGSSNLCQADLSNAYLRDANLIGAKLVESNFNHANLHHANLSQADLSNAYLRDANLIGAKLVKADLSRTNLSKANLVGADLSYSNLNETDLTDADLSFAILTNVRNFRTATLQGTNLRGADNIPIPKRDAEIKGAKTDRSPIWDKI